MRVMTFNLRFENDRDGDNAWVYRRDLVIAVIRTYKPAILGTQEGKWPQLMYLKEHLPEYEANLPGRQPDEKSQCPTLFFHKEAFAIEYGRDFWLSKTPDVHLSKDWDSAFPRMLSYARVRRGGEPARFVAGVTHLDHMGVEARYQQARIISEWVAGLELPVILMGDFNDAPDSPVHRLLTEPAVSLRDTWEVLAGPEDDGSFTHHGFNGVPRHARMDWVLVSPQFKVLDARIVRDDFNGSYPSDHYPYMADVEADAGIR
jgi:endonuclease/exonuclease/phosphatase family metal-dependent hydrolase